MIHEHANKQSLPFQNKDAKECNLYTLNHDKHSTLSLPSIKTPNHEQPRCQTKQLSHTFLASAFNSHAILEREPWS